MTLDATAPGPVTDDRYKWRAFGAIGSSFVIGVLSLSMVFVALPAIADDFDVTLKTVSWVVIANSLTISALLLPFGRLSDLIGRRRVHLIGLVLFAAGSVFTALAGSFTMLLVARVVAAFGGALTESVGTGILVSVFPDHERGKAIGSQTTSVAVGAAAGPLAAGIALEFFSWRALFLFVGAMSVVTFVIGHRILDERRISRSIPERRPFDVVGAMASTVLVVLFVVTVNNPFGRPWTSWPTLLAAAVLIIGFYAFVRWELAASDPMLQLRFFVNSTFSRAVTARILGFVAASAVYILLPILLVSIQGFSEGRAGVAVFLNSVGLGTAAQISGRLSDRFGTRRFMVAGFGAMALCMVAFAAMTVTTPLWAVAGVALCSGLAMGTWNVPNNATVLGTVPPTSYGVVGAFTNLARNVGNVFGQASVAAIVAGILVARGLDIPLGDIGDAPGGAAAFMAGWRAAFSAMAALCVIAAALTFTLKPDPAGRRD